MTLENANGRSHYVNCDTKTTAGGLGAIQHEVAHMDGGLKFLWPSARPRINRDTYGQATIFGSTRYKYHPAPSTHNWISDSGRDLRTLLVV